MFVLSESDNHHEIVKRFSSREESSARSNASLSPILLAAKRSALPDVPIPVRLQTPFSPSEDEPKAQLRLPGTVVLAKDLAEGRTAEA